MPKTWEGILAVEGELTGDGRLIDKGALEWDDGPWPLTFSQDTGGHGGATIGTITKIWRDGDNIRGEGTVDDDSDDEETRGQVTRALELLEDGRVGVSVELDSETVEIRMDKARWDEAQKEMQAWLDGEVPEPEKKGDEVVVYSWSFDEERQVVTSGRIRAAAIVDVPAIESAEIVAAFIALAASGAPNAFANPRFGADGDSDQRLVWQNPQRPEETGGWGCPLTVTDDGRVYGHASLKFRCHGAYEQCLTTEMLGQSMANWLIGDATGQGIPTGPIILDTTHGVTENGRIKSHDHLADTGTAVADVAAGVDAHGVWVAGRVRPGVTDRELAALRGSALSLEWHKVGNRLQIVGALAVNSPGYLIQRRGIAASFTTGATCCDTPSDTERIDTLEAIVASLMKVR